MQDTEVLKIPPHSIQAEQSVLGGLMIDNEKMDLIMLSPDSFYTNIHRSIFLAIKNLSAKDQPFDAVTVSNELGEDLEQIGGLAYLGSLARYTTSVNIETYANIVNKGHLFRQLISASSSIANLGFSEDDNALDEAQKIIMSIDQKKETIKTLKDGITNVIDMLDRKFRGDYEINSTGFADLDNATDGLGNGDLIIIAGRPSMGKTAFAMSLARTQYKNNKPVHIFSMEMPQEQIIEREISASGNIDLQDIRRGTIKDHDWPKITTAVGSLSDSKLHIGDSAGLTIEQLRSRARRQAKVNGKGLIIVDYIQLMSGNSKLNRTSQIEEITRGLKNLAKEMNVPVVALSQLNRALEQRPNKRPVMSDLRDSGSIEQDADVIMFIYRDEVYNPDTQDIGNAEIIISKQRNGPLGMIRLVFQGWRCRFLNYTRESDQNN